MIDVLTRIAVALEKIAGDQLNKPKKTPYPWHLVSNRTKNYMQRAAMREIAAYSPFYEGMSWPLTCDDLQKLGADLIREGRNVGEATLEELRKHLPEPFVIE